MLAAYSNSNQSNWDLYLPLVLFAYRTAEQTSTGYSPFKLLYGREPRLGDMDNYNIGYEPSMFVKNLHENWLLAREKIGKQAEISKRLYDSKYKTKPVKYKIGDLVRVYVPQTRSGLKKKLRNDLWSEPWEISKVLSEQNIEIVLNGKYKIVNVDNVKIKEPDRIEKSGKDVAYRTRFGRIIKPRVN